MRDHLHVACIAMYVTSYCSLNCKLCMVGLPFITDRRHTTVEDFDRQLCEISKIWDTVGCMNLLGGEALLHPNLCDLIETSLHYQNHFQTMRITTNGTIIPEDRLFTLISSAKTPWNFVISDYGKQLSRNVQGLTERLEFYHIPYRISSYSGDNQHFGGWVDLGDHKYVDLSEKELVEQYRDCVSPHIKYIQVYEGKVFECCHTLYSFAVKGVLPPKTEYIDLYDGEMTIEEKKEIASKFYTKPIESCQFCLGYNEKKSKRYPAAEQL